MTFLFDNFTNQSIPANPQIFRVRPDLEWVDVLREFHAQKRQQGKLLLERCREGERGEGRGESGKGNSNK